MAPRHLLLLVTLFSAVNCAGSTGDITLGMAGPFDAFYGQANKRGAELALEEINASGGIKGRRLSIDFQNDLGEGVRAAEIAQNFVNNPSISAVVGHISSGAMVAAAKVYDGHLAAVATTASSPELTGISPWVFRVISSDSANAVDMARFAQRLGKQRAAILYENDAYGRGLAENFRRNFSGEIILVDPIDTEGTRVDVHIDWFLSRNPDLIFVAGTERSALALLREARQRGLSADFLGGDGWTGVLADPEIAEGALIGAPFTALDPRPVARTFVAAYRARYDAEPDGNAALAYDTVKLLAAAINEVGTDRKAIRDWLASRTTDRAIEGVTGAIAFLPSGDPVGKSFAMTRVVDGRLSPVEGGQ